MKKIAVLLLVCCAPTWAQSPAVDVITQQDLRAHMWFLASDQMAGRNAASPEGRIAADYIATEFMKLGLKPAGDNGTYFQNFDLLNGMTDAPNTVLSAKIGGADRAFQLGEDFDLAAQELRNERITAPLVFAGYGVNAPEYGYNDLAGVDVRGKIVMVLGREPQYNDPKSRFKGRWDTYHSYAAYKTEMLHKAGAAGILYVRDGGPPRRKQRVPSGPTNNWQPTPRFSMAYGYQDLPVFTITRDAANQLLAGKNVDALQKQIDDTGKPASFALPSVTVTMAKAFTNLEVKRGRNVLALLEGSDPQLKNEYVVVSGHYDHVGTVGGLIYHGADDNASGAIATLEIAKAFVQGNVRPKRSIVFASWDAEERGLLGAFYYIDHPLVPLAATAANLNMDMVGRDERSVNWPTPPDGNTNQVNVLGSPYNPEFKEIVEQQNRAIGLKTDYKTDEVDPESWFARSDHFCFATRGVPMIFFNTGEQNDYHTANDTWDRINYPKFEKITRLVFLSAVEVANGAGRLKVTP